jgi:AcrR family transcriptional regulator
MNTPLRRSQKDRTALSDRLLMQSAVELLVEHGIAGTTLAAIGDRAGYSRGLVAHRFGSKMSLLAYVHDTVAADWIARVQSAVGKTVGIVALQRAVDALYEFIVEAPHAIRAMYILRYATIDPSATFRANVAKVLRAQQRDVQRWIEGGQANGSIKRQVTSAIAAELFCATLDGVLYRWLVDPSIPVQALHQFVRRQVRKALAASRYPLAHAADI